MDDGIELNFSLPTSGGVRRQAAPKKGGRWTDRVQAKRAVRDANRSVSQPKPVTVSVNTPALVKEKPAPQPKPAAPTPAPSASVSVAPKPAPPVSRPRAPPTTTALRPTAGPSNPRIEPAPRLVSNPVHTTSKPTKTARPRQSLPSSSTTRDIPPHLRADPGPSRLSTFIPEPPKPKVPQIISSLFTAEPLPAPAQTSQPVQTSGAPSNAPLAGDTSTFEGLGLDPLLIRHLKNKMHVEKPTGIQRSCLPHMLSSPLDPDQPSDIQKPLQDVLIQAQTGSGKTLSYLLPIVQTLLPLSRLSYIDRSIGTLAIILAPTRELAQQISKVTEQLLSLSLSRDEDDDRQFTRWLVSGLLTGGSTRTHEKARLRKGVPILVSTPGRLLDHLQNTSSFQCAKTMFLVLDEADRLMDLGFEETVQGIIKALEGRRRNEINVEKEMDEEGGGLMRWGFWGRGRTNVLCSATVDAKVEKLAGIALRDPVLFKGDKEDLTTTTSPSTNGKGKEKEKAKINGPIDPVAAAMEEASAVIIPQAAEDKFTPPSQLSQKYIVTPTKLRLVALVALLRSLIASAAKQVEEKGKGTKVIVFLSSTDSVDFHWKLLGGVSMSDDEGEAAADVDDSAVDGESVDSGEESKSKSSSQSTAKEKKKALDDVVSLTSALFPNTTLHRLHGSLPLRTRLSSLSAFAAPSAQPSVLFATSVASRGLDLPLVRAVVQYDLPTEGGANEYVHRVGRTARAGKGGEAWAFVAPSEVDWVPWVEAKMGSAAGEGVGLSQVGVEDVLRRGFGGKSYEYEGRATEVQLSFERWVLVAETNAALARKAFSSFVRAYSTHPIEEKKFFHTKNVHLGHLAKSFALREAPGSLTSASGPAKSKFDKAAPMTGKRKRPEEQEEGDGQKGGKELTARNETERRMYEAVRKQGRTIKSGGVLGAFEGKNGRKSIGSTGAAGGGGEFQVFDSGELERMVKKRIG